MVDMVLRGESIRKRPERTGYRLVGLRVDATFSSTGSALVTLPPPRP